VCSGDIENFIANRNSYPKELVRSFTPEYAERKILNWKVAACSIC
jgi:hypothetical protein